MDCGVFRGEKSVKILICLYFTHAGSGVCLELVVAWWDVCNVCIVRSDQIESDQIRHVAENSRSVRKIS